MSIGFRNQVCNIEAYKKYLHDYIGNYRLRFDDDAFMHT